MARKQTDNNAPIHNNPNPARQHFIIAIRQALSGGDVSTELGENLRGLKELSDTVVSSDPMFRAKLLDALVSCLEYGHICGRRTFIERLKNKTLEAERWGRKYRDIKRAFRQQENQNGR